MKSLAEQNYYELLDVAPSASAGQIEAAFTKAMAWYGPDSLATYSLVPPEEARRLIKLLEDAYLTLSDAEARRDYDLEKGFAAPEPLPAPAAPTASVWLGSSPFDDDEEEAAAPFVAPEPAPPPPPEQSAHVEPVAPPLAAPAAPAPPDPVVAPEPEPPPRAAPEPEKPLAAEPPAEAAAPVASPAPEPEHLPPEPAVAAPEPKLVEPEKLAEKMEPVPPAVEEEPARRELPPPPEQAEPLPAPVALARQPTGRGRDSAPPAATTPSSKPPGKSEIPSDAVYTGELLRRVRESRGTSLRDMSERTKIGFAHLENIEADHYGALPVTVYLRGFLMSLARELRLDPLKVSKSYLDLVAKSRQKT